MAAENTCRLVMARVGQRSCRDFGRKPQPARVQAIQETGEPLALGVPLLQLQVEQRAKQIIEADIVHDKQKDRRAAVSPNLDVYWLAIQRRVSTVLGSSTAV